MEKEMDIKELEKNELILTFKVTIPYKEVEEVTNQKAQEIAKTTKIDGFRPGKIPLSVIKSKYKNPLRSETIESFMESASKKIVTENKLTPSSTPEIHNVHFHEGKDLSFDIEIELLPSIPEIDFKKITLEKKVAEIAESEIKASLDHLSKDFKGFKPLPKDHAAKEGDTVLIDAIGFLDGKKFDEGQVTNTQLTLGANQFIPGFESGLVGIKAGDTRTLNLTFPKDYWKDTLAGQPVSFEVTAKEVSETTLPDMEDVAKKLNLKDFNELNEKITESLSKNQEQLSLNILKKELFDYLDENIKIQIPQKLVKKELEFLADNHEDEEKNQGNKKIATRRVKMGLILASFAKENKIGVSQDDVKNEIGVHLRNLPAQQHGMIIEYYKKNPQAIEHVKGKILEDKAIDAILKEIIMTEKKVTTDQLNKLFQEIK